MVLPPNLEEVCLEYHRTRDKSIVYSAIKQCEQKGELGLAKKLAEFIGDFDKARSYEGDIDNIWYRARDAEINGNLELAQELYERTGSASDAVRVSQKRGQGGFYDILEICRRTGKKFQCGG